MTKLNQEFISKFKMKMYKINCPKCNKKTDHTIYKISLKRGVKLKCISCGFMKEQYNNFKLIESKGGRL